MVRPGLQTYTLENGNIIAQPREHFLLVEQAQKPVFHVSEKSALIQDKGTPPEKIVIITMVWKTLGLYENKF